MDTIGILVYAVAYGKARHYPICPQHAACKTKLVKVLKKGIYGELLTYSLMVIIFTGLVVFTHGKFDTFVKILLRKR